MSEQIFLLSRSDCCDRLLNGGVQIEVWSSAVNPGRLFTNAYMNQTLKQALDSKICIEYVVSRVKTTEQTHNKERKKKLQCHFTQKFS